MPLIVRWPGVVPAESVCEEVVISNDFFPTFSEIAGVNVTPANIDGLSLVSLLKDPEAKLIRDAVYWHYPHYHTAGLGPQGAIRQGRYKLIEWYEKSAYGQAHAFELYDLHQDPGEQNNLADSAPEITSSLRGKLASWRKRVGAQDMPKNL